MYLFSHMYRYMLCNRLALAASLLGNRQLDLGFQPPLNHFMPSIFVAFALWVATYKIRPKKKKKKNSRNLIYGLAWPRSLMQKFLASFYQLWTLHCCDADMSLIWGAKNIYYHKIYCVNSVVFFLCHFNVKYVVWYLSNFISVPGQVFWVIFNPGFQPSLEISHLNLSLIPYTTVICR